MFLLLQTGQLTVSDGTTTPSISVVTGAVADAGTALATGGQIYDFVTGQGYLSSVDLTSDVSGVLPIANGGTGSSTQNFVDLSSSQTIGGVKTFSSNATFNGDIAVNGGDITSSSATFNFINSTTSTLNIGMAASTITIGSNSSTSKTTMRGDIAVEGGDITLGGATSVDRRGTITFHDNSSSTDFAAGINAPDAYSSSYTLTLPTSAGSASQVLTTDGTGNLSWTSPVSGTVTSVSSATTGAACS